MSVTSTPSITAPPPFPARSVATDENAYVDAAEAWGAAQPTFAEEVKAVGDAAEANATYAENRATASASSASSAATQAGNAATSAAAASTSEANAAASAASALGAPGTSATSTTSRSLGTGSKVFTLAQTGKLFSVGQTVVVTRTSDATKRMTGPITSFAADVLTVDVQLVNGSGGPYTDWTIALSAPPLTDIASQAEAEAGVVTDKLMTPERTAQAVAFLARVAPDVIIQDQRSVSTSGDTFTNTAWNRRTLNTVVRNAGGASLASNKVTLPAGTWLLRATTSAGAVLNASVGVFAPRIYDVTNSAVIAAGIGTSVVTNAAGTMECVAVVVLAAPTEVAVEVYASMTADSTAGRGGLPAGGGTEVYTTFEATKLQP